MTKGGVLLFQILFVLLTSTTYAFSDTSTDSLEVLQRIIKAELKVSYVGTRLIVMNSPDGTIVREEIVIHQPPRIHAVNVLSILGDARSSRPRDAEHGKDSAGPQALPQPGRVDKQREGKRSTRRRAWPWRKRLATLASNEIELLAQNYAVDLAPADAIAGHEADLLTISPRFDGRPTKRLYLSHRNGIILRIEDLDSDGNRHFTAVYTQISFDKAEVQKKLALWQRDEELKPKGQRRRSQPISLADAKQVLDNRLVQPTYLPPGFQLLEVRYVKGHGEMVYLRYTDGLVTFSLFETKGKSFLRSRGPWGRDKVSSVIKEYSGIPVRLNYRQQTHILRWSVSGVDFALVGNPGQSELIKVAESAILTTQE